MDKLNRALKILFALTAFGFLVILLNNPMTNCEACNLQYEGEEIDGTEAWEIVEAGCVSYVKPWDDIYVDLDDLNISKNDDGITVINYK